MGKNKYNQQQPAADSIALNQDTAGTEQLQQDQTATDSIVSEQPPKEDSNDTAAIQNDAVGEVQQENTTAAEQEQAPALKEAAAVVAPSLPSGLGMSAELFLGNIQDYIRAMAPAQPITVEEGCRQQNTLYRSLTGIINKLDGDFNAAFGVVLKLFEEHKDGALHEAYVFRFYDNLTLAESDRKAFQRIVNLIKLLAPVKGRELAMKQVDFTRSLEFGVQEPGRQRVLAYFNK